MLVKITITDQCGSRCATCPNWKTRPVKTMTPEFLRVVLDKLDPYMSVCCINGTGDYLSLPNHQDYSDAISDYFQRTGKRTFITTVGSFRGSPRINCSVIICSLNATDPENFAKYVGVDGGLQRVLTNFYDLIANHGQVEIHSLKWSGNPDPHSKLLTMFGHTHARIRISEKVENQLSTLTHIGEVAKIERVACDYLAGLTVLPDGRIRRCAHDWDNSSIFGNVWNIDAVIRERDKIAQQHRQEIYPGVCGPCNFNVAPAPPIYYIK